MSVKEQKSLFHTELIRVGIDFNQAEKAASILAQNLPNEQLSPEERQLIQDTCSQWLLHRKRMTFISQVAYKSQPKSIQQASSPSNDSTDVVQPCGWVTPGS